MSEYAEPGEDQEKYPKRYLMGAGHVYDSDVVFSNDAAKKAAQDHLQEWHTKGYTGDYVPEALRSAPEALREEELVDDITKDTWESGGAYDSANDPEVQAMISGEEFADIPHPALTPKFLRTLDPDYCYLCDGTCLGTDEEFDEGDDEELEDEELEDEEDCCDQEKCNCGNEVTFPWRLRGSKEERVVDPVTGGEKGRKEAELAFVDPVALEALARVAGKGSRKYEKFNYLRGFDYSLSANAMQRHWMAFWSGEDIDPESGEPHMAHAAWHALSLVSFMARGIGNDDRPKR